MVENKDKNIYLIRHLATSYNQNGTFMGRSYDMPINEDKIDEFLDRIDHMKWDINPNTKIYSSPSLRCKQTIEIVKNELHLDKSPINIDFDFQEANYGDFEGKNAKEIRAIYPRELDLLNKTPSQVRFPNGETLIEVQKRSISGIMQIVNNLENNNSAIICTHVDIIKLIIFDILKSSIDSKRYMLIENGSISCITATEEGLKVKLVNFI